MPDTDNTPSDTAAASRRLPHRRARRNAAAALALMLAFAAALHFYLGANGRPGTAQAQTAPAAPAVTVSQPLQREVTEWNEYTGQFTATESVEIRARVSGYLTEIHFEDGQFVKQGDLLFIIDQRPFEIALAQAQAQVVQQTARLDLANQQLKRATTLRERDVVSEDTYDQRMSEVRAATGALDVAQAAVRSAQLDLEFSRITAPMSGHISRHLVSIGNLVFGGDGSTSTLLTTIVATDPIYCVFDVSESDLLGYQRAAAQGQLKMAGPGALPLEARLFDDKGWPLKGQLNFVENQVDPGSGTLRARAVFPNPDSRILSGQFAQVRAAASQAHEALLVPDSAIVQDQSRKLLMVVREDNTVEPRVVEVGSLSDGLRVIRSGITAEDHVIINGTLRARPGAKVAPHPGKIEPAAS
jgi:RND family efflux transporter MFP subunit